MDLTSDQRARLETFREITADAHGPTAAMQILASCNWDVEQALQLHWATADEPGGGQGPTPTGRSSPGLGLGHGPMGAPLLSNDETPAAGSAAGRPAPARRAGEVDLVDAPRRGFLGRLLRGAAGVFARIGGSVISILGFIFGPGGGPRLGGGSGAAFYRRLASSTQGTLPRFTDGDFAHAIQTARRELRLLVVYLHSENARNTLAFCRDVLTNDFVRSMIDEHFVLWGGDIAWMESHNVAQMIRVRQYPCFCVLLPASIDEIRVIGMLHGDVVVDAVVGLLTTCMEEMDAHRAEIAARQEQHAEDRSLREQQDSEYEEALAVDRLREETRRESVRQEEEQRRIQEELDRKEREKQERIQADKEAIQTRRKRKASELQEQDVSDAKTRISMRLPAGQRVERKFWPSSTLADVYAWADCVAHLEENKERELAVPNRFELKTAFPTKVLTEMEHTVVDLKLSGANLLLAEIEEDEDDGA